MLDRIHTQYFNVTNHSEQLSGTFILLLAALYPLSLSPSLPLSSYLSICFFSSYFPFSPLISISLDIYIPTRELKDVPYKQFFRYSYLPLAAHM